MNWTRNQHNWLQVFDGGIPAHNPRARIGRDGSCRCCRKGDEIHRAGFLKAR